MKPHRNIECAPGVRSRNKNKGISKPLAPPARSQSALLFFRVTHRIQRHLPTPLGWGMVSTRTLSLHTSRALTVPWLCNVSHATVRLFSEIPCTNHRLCSLGLSEHTDAGNVGTTYTFGTGFDVFQNTSHQRKYILSLRPRRQRLERLLGQGEDSSGTD